MRARAVGQEANAAEDVTVGHAGRGDDDFPGRELVRREDLVHVVDPVLPRSVDLAARRRPELSLELPSEASQSSCGEQRLASTSDADGRWSFVPRMAAVIEAVTSPSWISLMRAPEALISSMRSWWRGRSRTIVGDVLRVAPEGFGDDAHVVSDRELQIDMSPCYRADGHLAHVHLRQAREAALTSPTAIIDMAP